jgi:hypothetical protein
MPPPHPLPPSHPRPPPPPECMAQALSLNSYLKELDLGGNPAPSRGGVKAAMVAALPWPLLQAHQANIRPQMILDEVQVRNLLLEACE